MSTDRISQKVAVSVVFVSAMFVTIIDTSIINVAIPTIGRAFDVSEATVDGVVIGFLVSLAVFIPVSGWLGDRLGTKRVLLGAIFIFTVASILCGAANSFGELVAFRVLQGVGGGLMTPVGMAMMFHAFPPEERLKASSILIIPAAIAPALGPVLGGVFTDELSWRWVFYVNVPVGVFALIFGAIFVQDTRFGTAGRFDLPGFVLAGAGLSLLMYGVSEGPGHGWSDPTVIITCLLGAVLLVALVIVELRTTEPMLDMRMYGNNLFRSTLTVMTLMSVSFFGVLYLVAIFYQNGLGLSALVSGLNVVPETIGMVISSRIIAKALYPKVGPRRIMAGGASLVAVMMVVLSLSGPGTSLWQIRATMLVLGAGMAAIFIPAQTAGFATVAPLKINRASTLFNTQQRLGGAIGVALITTIVTAVGPTRVVSGQVTPHLIAYRWGFWVAAAVMAAAAASALLIHDSDAAVTMRRPEPAGAVASPTVDAEVALEPELLDGPDLVDSDPIEHNA